MKKVILAVMGLTLLMGCSTLEKKYDSPNKWGNEKWGAKKW